MTTKLPDDCREFLKKYGYTSEAFEATKLAWDGLKEIRAHYESCRLDLELAAESVIRLLQRVSVIHSVKMRIKSADGVIEKVIRKVAKETGREVTVANYTDYITDRIGVRALHLYKDDWQPIHEVIKETFDLHEAPIAYVREGDEPSIRETYQKAGCDVQEHDRGYRSIHYLLNVTIGKVVHTAELQVRTLFEEGWSEIDHRVGYQHESINPYLGAFLKVFNRVAGTADEMATLIKALSCWMESEEVERANLATQLDKAISESKASKEEKASLRKQLEDLRRSSSSAITGQVTLDPGYSPWKVATGHFVSAANLNALSVGSLIAEPKCRQCGKPITDWIISTSALSFGLCAECRAKQTRGY